MTTAGPGPAAGGERERGPEPADAPHRLAGTDGGTGMPDGRPAPAGTHGGPRGVRDRQVVLLAGLVVALVLGLQALSLAFPPFADAIDNPPTVIALLVIVTVLVLARALLVARRFH